MVSVQEQDGMSHSSGRISVANLCVVTNVLRRSPDVLEGPRVEKSSPAGSYQLPVCCLCAGVRKRGH